MKNTLENKAKFFAQYFGQKVLMDGSEFEPLVVGDDFNITPHLIVDDHLNLRQLASATAEEKIEVALIFGYDNLPNDKLLIYGQSIIDTMYSGATLLTCGIIDYLRGQSFAIFYHDLSVEELTEYGWIKLTNHPS